VQATHTQAQKKIAGIRFPATRAELVEYAGRNGGDQELLDGMRRMPERVYRDPHEVGDAFADITGE
jgi:hypothetical protein